MRFWRSAAAAALPKADINPRFSSCKRPFSVTLTAAGTLKILPADGRTTPERPYIADEFHPPPVGQHSSAASDCCGHNGCWRRHSSLFISSRLLMTYAAKLKLDGARTRGRVSAINDDLFVLFSCIVASEPPKSTCTLPFTAAWKTILLRWVARLQNPLIWPAWAKQGHNIFYCFAAARSTPSPGSMAGIVGITQLRPTNRLSRSCDQQSDTANNANAAG